MNKSIVGVIISQLIFAMIVLVGIPFAEDGKEYLAKLKSPDYETRVQTLKKIEQAAIHDQQLFDTIESNLLAGYLASINDKKQIVEMGWLCDALASSGDSKYLPTLRLVGSSNTGAVANHCRQGEERRLAFHKERVAAMTQPPFENMSTEDSVILRMLQSSLPKSVQFGVQKAMSGQLKDERVYDAARDALMAGYLEKVNDNAHVDAMSWLCKCLGFSKMEKYRDTLTLVREKAQHWKLRDYAGKSLVELGKSAPVSSGGQVQ